MRKGLLEAGQLRIQLDGRIQPAVVSLAAPAIAAAQVSPVLVSPGLVYRAQNLFKDLAKTECFEEKPYLIVFS